MREIQEHALYRHFKGNLYYVIGTAKHSETQETMVVYQALYGTRDTWVRPLELFLSEVEEGKENPTGQTYRFELVN